MKKIILFIFLFSLQSCATTSNENVVNDIESYSLNVLNVKITDLKLIDNDASCLGKSESYIYSSAKSNFWFKWDKLRLLNGEYEITVCVIPVNFTNYSCNPELNYKRKYQASIKYGNKWIERSYQE